MADTPKSFHEQIADKLIEQLKQGTAPWQKPWKPGDPGAQIPLNPSSGKRYRGINAIHLMSQGRTDQRWLTYKQATALDAQVRKGEKGTTIQYWKFTEEQVQKNEAGQPVLGADGQPIKQNVRLERPKMFLATVFNAEQIDGLPELQRKPPDWNASERAEQLLQASGAAIFLGETDRAFYRPSSDSIHLPFKDQFPSAENYYATALHELGHWTGHESRLARDLVHPFGSEAYAREELRAEIASMILGDELGLGHDPGQHAAYVSSWISALENDPMEIFRAAADAEKIYGYVLALEQKQEQDQSTSEQITPEPNPHEQAAKFARAEEARVRNDPSSTAEDITAAREQRKSAELAATLNDQDLQRRIAEFEQKAVQPDKTYIEVSYKDKEEAKTLGAKWDRQEKSWYIPSGADHAKFKKWTPGAQAADNQAKPVNKPKTAQKREFLAVPFEECAAAKAAGALWDKSAKSWYVGPEANTAKLQRWRPENVATQQSPAVKPQEEFAEALRSMGCVVSGEHPMMDGQKHRISVEGEKHSEKAGSGYYVAHLDGHPAGYIKNYKTGADLSWKAKGYVLDDAQKTAIHAQALQKAQARAAEQECLHEQTAQRIAQHMQTLVPVTKPTPYMQSKGIAPQPGVLTDAQGQTTYIPAVDVNGKQWTVQYIREDGSKRFAKDSRKEGCFHVVGGDAGLTKAPVLIIGEGYSTLSSVSQSVGFATVAAFDSGNLLPVAKALHDKHPDKPVVIVGDDDKHLELMLGTNPGRQKAEAAAQAVGGKVLLPIFAPGEQSYPHNLEPVTPEIFRKGELSDEQKAALSNMKQFTDFNDLAMRSTLGREGLDRQVRAVVENVIELQRARSTVEQEDLQLVRVAGVRR
jgi:putative DNA primase/helicase